jgi:TorA maturation chaperone TorD
MRMGESEARAQRAGRAALFDTLAELLLRELEAPLAEQLRDDPVLHRVLRPPEDLANLVALRADYARLFLVTAPPYASIYLDDPPVIGGESARRWEAMLRARGRPLASVERAAASDHAGLFLRALAQAERDGDANVVLAEALRWLPQYLTALRFHDSDGFYGRVGELTTVAVWESTRATRGPATDKDDTEHDRGAPPLPEEDNLRSLVAWLCAPAHSGWYLSKPQLRRLGQSLGVATGVTDREHMLTQVFEASGLDGRTGYLLDALRAEHARWSDARATWERELERWSSAVRPWRARLGATDTLLAHLRDALDQYIT